MRLLPTLALACLLLPLNTCISPTNYEQGSIDVVFCQQENCEERIIDALNAAGDAQCAFYDSNLENLTNTLLKKNVPTLIFQENDEDAPPSWTRVSSSGLMHNKYCVLDKKITITGSMNPTHNGAYKNDNNLVFIESETIAQNYLAEWTELQTRKQKATTNTEVKLNLGNRNVTLKNYFCPEDSCEEKILEELAQAQESIYFMTFTFTSDPIGELLLEKHAGGIAVQGVFEKRQGNRYSEYPKLFSAGADVRKDGNPYTMHHKVFIIDPKSEERATVITGSFNPTKSANTKNDENILIIHDATIAQEFMGEFDRVWARASPVTFLDA